MPAVKHDSTGLWRNHEKFGQRSISLRHALLGARLDDNDDLEIYRGVGQNAKGLKINQADTTNNPRGLEVVNAGTGNGVFIDQNGNGISLNIDSEATTSYIININGTTLTTGRGIDLSDLDALTTGKGIYVKSNSTSDGSRNLVQVHNNNILATGTTLLTLTQDSIGRAIVSSSSQEGSSLEDRELSLCAFVCNRTETRTSGTTEDDYDVMALSRTNVMNGAGGTLTAEGSILKLNITSTETAGTLTDTTHGIEITNGTASGGNPINIINSGTSQAIFINHDTITEPAIKIDADASHATNKVIGMTIDVDNGGAGDQVAIDIDQVDESKSYFARFNATTAWTSTKNPETNAEDGWIKIMVGSTAYFIPYYAAS